MPTSTSQGRMASTGRGVTTRASTRAITRMSDYRGRRRVEARPERWLERETSTPVPGTPPLAQAVVKTKGSSQEQEVVQEPERAELLR
jgi:hypothetical protein